MAHCIADEEDVISGGKFENTLVVRGALMDRRQTGVKLVLDGLGLGFKIGAFFERLILQKAIYLAQAGGINLGYHYQWYLHGPYSPALTRDAFSMQLEITAGMDDSGRWVLDDASRNRVGQLRRLIPDQPDPMARARKLELLASVYFLIDRKQVSGRDVKQITDLLVRFNKNFTHTEVQDALGELVEHGLLGR